MVSQAERYSLVSFSTIHEMRSVWWPADWLATTWMRNVSVRVAERCWNAMVDRHWPDVCSIHWF